MFQLLKWLGLHVSYVVLGVDVFQANHPLVDEVSYEAIPYIDVLGSFVVHTVTCHVHGPLAMHVHKGGCDDLDNSFNKGYIQSVLACIRHRQHSVG